MATKAVPRRAVKPAARQAQEAQPEPRELESPAEPAAEPVQENLLDKLLALAEGCINRGSFRQAADIYFELVQAHPDSPEAKQARRGLLDLATMYEQQGMVYQAKAIYEKLL